MLICINGYMLNMLLLLKYLPWSMVLLYRSFSLFHFPSVILFTQHNLFGTAAEYLVSKDSVSNISEIISSGSPDNQTKVCFLGFSLCVIICSSILASCIWSDTRMPNICCILHVL
jgi:hypothetical protein